MVQGRELNAEDIGEMQGLLAEHPDWGTFASKLAV